MRLMSGLAAIALAAGTPAAAQDEDLARDMRRFADITAGQQTGSATPVDKLLRFERRSGQLVVTTIAVAPPAEWPELPQGGIAVMRTRAAGGDGNRIPPDGDFEFVRRTHQRLFVVGEWAQPAQMWEIIRESSGDIRFREIRANGAPGPWLTPIYAPAGGAR